MNIPCVFQTLSYSHGESFYGCVVKNQQILEDQDLKFVGKHHDGKTNLDVREVWFQKCSITRIPQGLKKIFPNFKNLDVTGTKLNKLSKNDLIEYKNLEKFVCTGNEIEFLPGDLLEGFTNLNYVTFQQNRLKFIEPNIFDGLTKLKLVFIDGNTNYSKNFSEYQTYDAKSTLDEVKCELYEKFFSRFKFLQDLKESEESLKQKNQILEAELEKERLKNPEFTRKYQKGFLSDLKTFTQDETTKDFKIIIEGQEFQVHKFLLAARSPTLAEILKNNPEVENLNLVDISVEIFEIILKFLYTDELPGDDGMNFLQLFAVAGKLKIEELKEFAATKLVDHIDEENAIEVFKLSNKYGHEELRQKAFDELKKCYPNYKFKDEWMTKTEIVVKVIEQFKKAEEAIRKLEDEFENTEIN